MSMFGLRIWAYNESDPEWKIARSSGWSRADLQWERLLEVAIRRYIAGDTLKSSLLFWRAYILAKLRFNQHDLRLATSAANLAQIAIHYGRRPLAGRLQAQALKIWESAPQEIASMKIAPRARSSLFHLRMEAKHRDVFEENMRRRLSHFAKDTHETLVALCSGTPTPHRHFSRWLGEKPGVFDDTRKILGACLLMPERPQQ